MKHTTILSLLFISAIIPVSSSIVELKIGATMYAPYLYTRTASDAAIRIKLPGADIAFGVVIQDGETKRSYKKNDQPWNLVKL